MDWIEPAKGYKGITSLSLVWRNMRQILQPKKIQRALYGGEQRSFVYVRWNMRSI